jgi:predicted RNA binding protein YcfA (HicA-like mRNA interferase family)
MGCRSCAEWLAWRGSAEPRQTSAEAPVAVSRRLADGGPDLDGLVESAQKEIAQLPVKVREILELLSDDGWEIVATRGSHRQLKHPGKPGRVTVAGRPSKDLHPKTAAASFVRQA